MMILISTNYTDENAQLEKLLSDYWKMLTVIKTGPKSFSNVIKQLEKISTRGSYRSLLKIIVGL